MSDTVLSSRVLPHFYRDSVALMAIASTTEKRDGVVRVGAVMATPSNLGILAESGMLPDGLTAAPDDLVFVVRGSDAETVDAALDAAEAGLTAVDGGSASEEVRPGTIREGLAAATQAERPANLVTISIAGTYAPVVAEQALRDGMHVLCFSDNVSVDDEVRLKTLAVEKRLLMMGPDCGTAIIDGLPLGFANVVAKGSVGIVAASGTGAQEVSRLLDAAGAGVSQLIGVGGRDLSADVGGLMANLALDFLVDDPDTSVIMMVSKPPAPEVADALLTRLAGIAADGTPVVACFLGQDDSRLPTACSCAAPSRAARSPRPSSPVTRSRSPNRSRSRPRPVASSASTPAARSRPSPRSSSSAPASPPRSSTSATTSTRRASRIR